MTDKETNPEILIMVLNESLKDCRKQLSIEKIFSQAKSTETSYVREYSDKLNSKLEEIRRYAFSELTEQEKISLIKKVFIANKIIES